MQWEQGQLVSLRWQQSEIIWPGDLRAWQLLSALYGVIVWCEGGGGRGGREERRKGGKEEEGRNGQGRETQPLSDSVSKRKLMKEWQGIFHI